MSFAPQSRIGATRRFVAVAAALAICAAAGMTHLSTTRASARPGFGADKKVGGLAPDKGKFKILVNGQVMGKEEFEIGSSGGGWLAHGNSEITTPQGVTKVTGTLTARPDGSPQHYDWATQGVKKASAAISFNADVATAELHVEGARPYTQQFTFESPMVVILDDNMYHQYQILADLYDAGKGGDADFHRSCSSGIDARQGHRRLARQAGCGQQEDGRTAREDRGQRDRFVSRWPEVDAPGRARG